MNTAVGRLRIPESAGTGVARRSLQWRVLTLVTIGIVAVAGVLVASNLAASRETRSRLLEERRALAVATAGYVDYVVRQGLRSLDDLSAVEGFDLEDSDNEPETDALRRAFYGSIFSSGLYVADAQGVIVAIDPGSQKAIGVSIRSRPDAMTALTSGRPAVSGYTGGAAGHDAVVSMAVPVRNRSGQVVGVIGGDVGLSEGLLGEIIRSAAPGKDAYAQVVDSRGTIIASTRPQQMLKTSDHAEQMANLIVERRAVSSACHSCHTGSSESGSTPQVMAFAPLELAPWGVVIRQSEDEALAATGLLDSRVTWFGVPAVALALLFSWATVRSIVKPVRTLTVAADRVAAGDLSQPVPAMGKDEIGGLARAFETMRVRLKDALNASERWAAELEARVHDRTRELEASRDHLRAVAEENAALNEELKRRDAARTELMGQVIGAQEDERRRIARELHDETSQALTVLVMGMETAASPAARDSIEERLAALKHLAVQTLDGVHRLIYDLRPSVLDDLGLVPGLRWCAEGRLEPLGVRVSVMVTGQERRLRPEVETAVFRIGQEAISNIARHSGAANAFVNVVFEDDAVVLDVEDDGQGFDADAIDAVGEGHRGWGLLGMRERAALLGGSASIESEPGAGTHVRARVPLPGGQA